MICQHRKRVQIGHSMETHVCVRCGAWRTRDDEGLYSDWSEPCTIATLATAPIVRPEAVDAPVEKMPLLERIALALESIDQTLCDGIAVYEKGT